MVRNGKPTNFSGKGDGSGNTIAWLVSFILFLACLWSIGQWDFHTIWPWGLSAMACAVLTFMVPKQFLGRSDTVDHERIHDAANATQHNTH